MPFELEESTIGVPDWGQDVVLVLVVLWEMETELMFEMTLLPSRPEMDWCLRLPWGCWTHFASGSTFRGDYVPTIDFKDTQFGLSPVQSTEVMLLLSTKIIPQTQSKIESPGCHTRFHSTPAQIFHHNR